MSDGPLAIIQRWSSNSTSPPTAGTSTDSSLYFWLKLGVTGLAFGLLANHLLGYGELLWEDASWVLVIFFVLYTFCLILAVSYLSQSSGQTCNENYTSFTPSHPLGLTRLRSYLTFFPISHVIHHHHPHHHGSDNNSNNGRAGNGSSALEAMAAAHANLSNEADDQGLAIRINAQTDMAIDAIVAEYVIPWYTKISDDRSFLEQCKAIIHAVFLQLGEKLRQVDRNEFAKEAIQIIHVHWREYTEALAKCQQANNGREELAKHFKFVHPFLQDNKEVSKRYQQLVTRVLEELHIPDLSSPVMCQFLAGIVVKNFVLYYAEMICQPSWINSSLMSLLSSGSLSVDITGSSSQNSSSPASPLPEPSPKPLNIFPDEAIECASICPSSSTAGSTPTKKSRHSSGRSASAQSFHDELSIKEEMVTPEPKHFFDNASSSLDEGSSASEPKTESSIGTTGTDSARPSPTDKKFPQKSSGSSSSGMSMTNQPIFGPDSVLMLTKRPKDLLPLKQTASSLRTLSTALGSVMQATAFPLLPSECYNTEENNSVLNKYCQPPLNLVGKELLKGQHPVLEEISESDSQSESMMVDTRQEGFELDFNIPGNDSEIRETQIEREIDGKEMESTSSLLGTGEEELESPSKGLASHYYSFDEASKPKSASTSFFETSTLSLDGALDKSKRQASQDQLSLCSHEFKGELDSDGKPNRSPVYEEPEDFAASIAKLRSLLEQKGRKSSTPPPLSATAIGEDGEDVFESPPSSSPSTCTTSTSTNHLEKSLMCMDNIPQISETCASESHTTPSSTSSMDNSKASSRFSFNEPINIPSETDSTIVDAIERTNYEPVPEIKCCFRNVTIPKVENSADAGGQYMFYCIQYEGVYYDDKEDGEPPKLVYRTTTIKRKFKEFLTLQAHLEENAACKPHLKGIKTPTRWTNVSLTKSDATVANQRRAMLEKYLQQLCYHPVVGFCQEVMIFMAYGEDGFCSFEVGDPKDLLTHRLDKLARKFTGVINSLKDALPSFELDLSPAPNTPKSEGITPCDLKPESSFPSFPFQEKFSSLPHDKELNLEPPWTDKFVEGWTSEHPESLKEGEGKAGDVSAQAATFNVEPEIEVEEGKIFSAYPLAAAMTQLLCDVLWLPQYRPHPASVATFMSISGKSLENYVLETMDIFLSDEAVLGYLEWLTISINNGQSESDSRYDIMGSEYCSEEDLKNIVKRRIPAWVRWMWGRNRLELTIDRITGLFQNPLVNHDLALSLCELLFSKMVIVEDTNSE